ncbi:MAG: biotin--[acetyl-CoA-carboxylase] ligase [Chitinophagaceae bacterium]|nr:biotin--[acetyl-CoA-carboxylase] ligase [Chitinophagaceae bacterium]MCW5925685.1 biotin--[acetyl-CoA-carboxylase] ligase [Chitinophagaceae bacterium]
MQSLGHPFTVLPSVDSTNNYAMQKVHARLAKHGAAWLALEQTHGKGQRGKHWIANKGENIYLSIVAEPDFLKPDKAFSLVAAVALGTYNFVKKYLGEKTAIKWPNDIYWGDRKAVGILIENIIQPNKWTYSVIGIGVNINQVAFDSSLKNPVSWKQVTGITYDVISLARELCGFIDSSYRELTAGESIILQDYQNAMYKLNQPVQFRRRTTEFSAVVKGVTKDGKLVISGEQTEQVDWGSVEWLI